jgi:hypothetical protein|tara:strand:- start:36 stop:659 length:624 start_codon:yes stop_codon:yes gene_type:complete
MKKLLILLLSLFLLSSPSVFADDISDFEIEGISIGDSLLDYMSEDEILKGMEVTKDYYLYLKEPNKFAEVYLYKDFLSYDRISFFVKNNSTNEYVTNKNEKYTIVFIRGLIDYNEDFDGCIAKRNEISEIFSSMFPNLKEEEYGRSHNLDPSGDSKFEAIRFIFAEGGYIEAQCNNWEETFRIKNNYSEGLSVAIVSKELEEWFLNR